MSNIVQKTIARSDNEVGVIDDIDDVITGESVKMGDSSKATGTKVFEKLGQKMQGGLDKGVAAVGQGVAALAGTVTGVDKKSDTTFDGRASTAGGAAGFAERKAEAEIVAREQNKQKSKNLFTRFLDIQDDGFNKIEEKHQLDEVSQGKYDGFGF